MAIKEIYKYRYTHGETIEIFESKKYTFNLDVFVPAKTRRVGRFATTALVP